MALAPRKLGLALLIYLAVLGYALVAWVPQLVDGYERLAARHPRLAYAYLAAVGCGALVLLGISLAILWRLWRNTAAKRRTRHRRRRNPSELSSSEQRAELADNLAASEQFAEDAATSAAVAAQLKQQLETLQEKQQAQSLEIVAFGTISSGKSSLLNVLAGTRAFAANVVGGTTTQRCEIPWPGNDRVTLVDTPGLAEVRGEQRAALASSAAANADLVLLVIDGPLKHYEVDLAKSLLQMEKRLLVCLNKEDWYDEAQQQRLLDQVAEQLPQIPRENLIAVRSQPVVRTRIRVRADGSEHAEEVTEPPDVTSLAARMLELVRKDGSDLLMANLLLQSRGLVEQSKLEVRAGLDKRAQEVISRYMWAAGGAAGINPFPLLDLAGGSAITLKMTLELARVYQQKLDADMAVQLLQQLSKNLVAMLGAVAATPAVASLIASLLKTVPGVGTIAGGLVQGLVQALVTRWIGNVFAEYLRNEMKPPAGGLAETARRQWEAVTSTEALRQLIREGRSRLTSRHD